MNPSHNVSGQDNKQTNKEQHTGSQRPELKCNDAARNYVETF